MALKEMNVNIESEINKCHCLAACNAIEYNAEVTQAEFNLISSMSHFGDKSKWLSKIDLFFKKPKFVTMQRRELFGLLDLLANIGGLMGVFLGFSFLSLIEIFYFLTMRVGFTLKRDLEEEEAKKTNVCIVNGLNNNGCNKKNKD